MKLQIELREEWAVEVAQAMGDEGSNDAEHDLLMEVYEQVVGVFDQVVMPPGSETWSTEVAMAYKLGVLQTQQTQDRGRKR